MEGNWQDSQFPGDVSRREGKSGGILGARQRVIWLPPSALAGFATQASTNMDSRWVGT